ncbi:hypothetical protein HO133_006311 [Letharia lupina]|uniref:Uncharacterized protein n=1 Tax=Letharia lupina TaxID=560253 RepID=A0A8H6C768_9LECA|nr:uncharacterized protein HO133_006311 [Letharia lupina]KAF6217899.1 hypothetical protein HO133_006311 [Letharia lupina]
MNCPHPDSVIPPGTHCVNLEIRQCSDPKHFQLHYEPAANLRKIKQTPKGRGGLYGLGKHGEERYCVGCLEKMLEEHRRRLQRKEPQAVFLPGHPIFEIAYWIIGDQRVIPNRGGKFTLRSFKIYGIELWKARWLWNRCDANPDYVLTQTPGRTDMIQHLPGRYPRAIYLQPEDKEYRGLFDDNTVGEISSDEVADCSLTEVLGKLDACAVAHERLKAQLSAARKLVEKSAADARRAECHRKINERADRQRQWEEIEEASIIYKPRPRTVPIVRCSTPTPAPKSPRTAPVVGDDIIRKSSLVASDALLFSQNYEIGATLSAKSATAIPSTGQRHHDIQRIEMATDVPATNEHLARGIADGNRPLSIMTAWVTIHGTVRPPISKSARTSPKGNQKGDLVSDGVDDVVLEGRGKPGSKAIDPFEETDMGDSVDIRPREQSKGSGEYSEDDKKPFDTVTAGSTSLEKLLPATLENA